GSSRTIGVNTGARMDSTALPDTIATSVVSTPKLPFPSSDCAILLHFLFSKFRKKVYNTLYILYDSLFCDRQLFIVNYLYLFIKFNLEFLNWFCPTFRKYHIFRMEKRILNNKKKTKNFANFQSTICEIIVQLRKFQHS